MDVNVAQVLILLTWKPTKVKKGGKMNQELFLWIHGFA
jgi:hypothetical protein